MVKPGSLEDLLQVLADVKTTLSIIIILPSYDFVFYIKQFKLKG